MQSNPLDPRTASLPERTRAAEAAVPPRPSRTPTPVNGDQLVVSHQDQHDDDPQDPSVQHMLAGLQETHSFSDVAREVVSDVRAGTRVAAIFEGAQKKHPETPVAPSQAPAAQAPAGESHETEEPAEKPAAPPTEPQGDPHEEEGSLLGKVLGPAGAVLGVDQVVRGLSDKNNTDKALDITAGSSATISGSAATAVAYGGSEVALGGLALAPIAVGAGGAGAVFDGLKDVHDGLQKGEDLEVAGGGIKAVGGAITLAGLATAQPELVVLGGLTYIGGRLVKDGKEIGSGLENSVSQLKDGFNEESRA